MEDIYLEIAILIGKMIGQWIQGYPISRQTHFMDLICCIYGYIYMVRLCNFVWYKYRPKFQRWSIWGWKLESFFATTDQPYLLKSASTIGI